MKTIEDRIRAFLALRRPPQHLKDDATKERLIAEIVKTVSKHAPPEQVDEWIGQVVERAMISHKGNGWPSPDVWAASVGAATYGTKTDAAPESPRDRDLRIFCARIAERQPVDENSLFGELADRSLQSGKISFVQLREYQRNAFNARRKMYGTDKAFAWADDRSPALAADMRRANEQAESEVRKPYADDETVDGVPL